MLQSATGSEVGRHPLDKRFIRLLSEEVEEETDEMALHRSCCCTFAGINSYGLWLSARTGNAYPYTHNGSDIYTHT